LSFSAFAPRPAYLRGKIGVSSFAALFLLAAGLHAQTSDWIATLVFGPVKPRLALHLMTAPGGSLTATADSIDQDAFDLPVTRIEQSGSRLRFEIPRLSGRFAGAFSGDGQVLEGLWTQRGGTLPIRFERGNIRPQEPSPPYPYVQEPVVYRSGSIRLAGTLTLPRTPAPHPAVVLITGSGPQDRNDTVSGHRPFLVWADFLTRRGCAVLRADDRGVGGSSGKLLDSTDEDFAADALAAVEFLQSRPEIDPRRIGLLGHSEGAVVAAIAASNGGAGEAVRAEPDSPAASRIAFVVLLAGPALPGAQIVEAQNERISRALGIPGPIAEKNREIQRKLFAILASEPGGAAAHRKMQRLLARETAGLSREEAAVVRGQVGTQILTAASRWFRFVLSYDPRPALAKLACPVLALYGSLDLQVPAEINAPLMEQSLSANPHHQVITLPGLNHMLQRAHTGSPAEYAQIEETVAPVVLETVGGWLAPTFLPPQLVHRIEPHRPCSRHVLEPAP